jgi:hypothetical protein
MPAIICLASAHRIDTHLPARYIRLFNLSPRIDTHLPALVFLCLFNLSPRIDTHLPARYYTFVCCCAEIAPSRCTLLVSTDNSLICRDPPCYCPHKLATCRPGIMHILTLNASCLFQVSHPRTCDLQVSVHLAHYHIARLASRDGR